MSGRMRAASQAAFGGPEVLTIVERDRPTPGPGEVLVRVRAASVNHGETKVRAGLVPGVGPPPFTLGSDLAGTVAATGPGAARFRPGDAVCGVFFIGTYAEYVAVPEGQLAAIPDGLDQTRAAALPVAALTAWRAIAEVADVGPGQRILIHAAAGGVGHLAVQLAKLRGALVIGTARTEKHPFLRDLGADEAIDYTTTDFAEAARNVDVVFDLIGGGYGPRSLRALRPGGLLLGAALNPGVTPDEARASGRRYAWVSVRPDGETLAHLLDLFVDGRLRVHIEQTFPLERLALAHELSELGRVVGKLVITL